MPTLPPFDPQFNPRLSSVYTYGPMYVFDPKRFVPKSVIQYDPMTTGRAATFYYITIEQVRASIRWLIRAARVKPFDVAIQITSDDGCIFSQDHFDIVTTNLPEFLAQADGLTDFITNEAIPEISFQAVALSGTRETMTFRLSKQ